MAEQIALTSDGIAALMGAGPDRGRSIARPAVDLAFAPQLPNNVPAELLGRRADVVAARYRVEAAASRIKRAKAGFYPDVNLVGLAGLQSLGISRSRGVGAASITAAPATRR